MKELYPNFTSKYDDEHDIDFSGVLRVEKGGEVKDLSYGRFLHIRVVNGVKISTTLPPDSKVALIYTPGSNVRLTFDQYWDFSNLPKNYQKLYGRKSSIEKVQEIGMQFSPQELNEYCNKLKVDYCIFSSGEPLLHYTFLKDLIELNNNLKLGIITNGFINYDPVKEVLSELSYIEIRLHSVDNYFYKKHLKVEVWAVLEFIERLAADLRPEQLFSISTMLVDGLNDEEADLMQLFNHIKGLDPLPHLILERFHPSNRILDKEKYPISRLQHIQHEYADALKVDSSLRLNPL